MSQFLKAIDVPKEAFEWGEIGWLLTPRSGGGSLVVIDATLKPGHGHAFHRHPGQEEVIIVKQGSITQYLEKQTATLEAGDSVYVEAGVVHASYNDSSEVAHIQVIITPAVDGDSGYGLEDVSGEEPWRTLRV